MNRLFSFLTFGCIVLLSIVAGACKNDSPVQSPPIVQDTTSHAFVFYKDTLGTFSSSLNDVFMINENDVWTVGEIHTKDTDKYDSLHNWIQPYNAAHWDGVKWNLLRIEVCLNYGSGQIVRTNSDIIQTVFAPVPDDVWFVSRAGGVTRWHNQTWNEIIPPAKQGPGQAIKIFGQASDDIFLFVKVVI